MMIIYDKFYYFEQKCFNCQTPTKFAIYFNKPDKKIPLCNTCASLLYNDLHVFEKRYGFKENLTLLKESEVEENG